MVVPILYEERVWFIFILKVLASSENRDNSGLLAAKKIKNPLDGGCIGFQFT